MRKLVILGYLLLLVAGCDPLGQRGASTGKTDQQKAQTPSNNQQQVAYNNPHQQPGVHAPTGVVTNPGGGGGSGGAVQAVRGAVRRTVDQNELNNIRLFIDTASLASGQMPTAQATYAALQREAPSTFKLVQEGAIILTGARSRESVWAYTAEPQTYNGEHLVVTSSGVERMNGQVLRQRLQQQ